MKFIDVFKYTEDEVNIVNTLRNECLDFFQASHGEPLLKNLPTNYNDFHKVKVRKKKKENDFTETFNEAFQDETYDLRQRAIFANGVKSFIQEKGSNCFYIFPTNGFKFLYSVEVENSGADYKHVFDYIFEHFGADKGQDIVVDILKFNYTNRDLLEGIQRGSEIIIYNVPYYYALRTEVVVDYEELVFKVLE